MIEPSDEMLVRAVLAGQRAAYEKLYDRYAALVRAVCIRSDLIPNAGYEGRE